jgi:hypothetical protein
MPETEGIAGVIFFNAYELSWRAETLTCKIETPSESPVFQMTA